MRIRAAVLETPGSPLEVGEIDLAGPGPGEVLVRLGGSGVCHTDLSIAEGKFPAPLPVVLGHEAAGTVEAVGSAVTRCRPGDSVVLSLRPQCGTCFWCERGQPHLCGPGSASSNAAVMMDGTSRLSRNGTLIYQVCGLGAFAEAVVAPETAVVPIAPDVPPDLAALLGCAVLTGIGAALNTAHIGQGDTVAVLGCGGVGLNVVQGARVAGAARIIALDRVRSKLDLALKFGATDAVVVDDDPVPAVLELTGNVGVDVAFDVVGGESPARQALAMTRMGGQCCLVGMGTLETILPVAVTVDLLVMEKKILGCAYGSADIQRDIPKILQLHAGGQVLLEELISQRIGLDGVDEAFSAMKTGELARSVVTFT